MMVQQTQDAPTTPGQDRAALSERRAFNRAVEAVNWAMPMVNYDRMFQAAHALGADFNQIVFWSRLPDWKNQRHL
jgi:hypothetical protein